MAVSNLPTLPRREFLRLLGMGLTATYIEQHIGLWDRVRGFFIPSSDILVPPTVIAALDWNGLTNAVIALQLEKVQSEIPMILFRGSRMENLLRSSQPITISSKKMRVSMHL